MFYTGLTRHHPPQPLYAYSQNFLRYLDLISRSIKRSLSHCRLITNLCFKYLNNVIVFLLDQLSDYSSSFPTRHFEIGCFFGSVSQHFQVASEYHCCKPRCQASLLWMWTCFVEACPRDLLLNWYQLFSPASMVTLMERCLYPYLVRIMSTRYVFRIVKISI